MTTLSIMASSTPGLTSTLSWSTLGYMLLVVGIVATYLSGRRYLLGYLIGGMGYWIAIEGIQSIVVNVTSVSSGFGYLTAILISVAMLGAYLAYRYKQFVDNLETQKSGVESLGRRTVSMSAAARVRTPRDKYIEHTPIYNNYEPRFRN
ncbi:AciT family ciprofloxacin tolerance protein [Psychrobacter sp.]|uniref:AciT family ciprofloxacin tolerance protein n=1 Tax=Psychrobacter sp. TaxID=56811 RepID=UPI0025E1D272|nr:AciT family ciprofloxacin tolerance protein [Psychrobacter sp.]